MVGMGSADPLDDYVARLYRAWESVPLHHFMSWAVSEMRPLVKADGILWGTGNLNAARFHFKGMSGLDPGYPDQLAEWKAQNPMLPHLLRSLGSSVRLSQVVNDDEFYSSPIYQQMFKRFGIERIMSFAAAEPRSGLITLMSWYRFDRDHDFTAEEAALQERMHLHISNAALNVAHAFFAIQSGTQPRGASAICDRYGHFYEAESEFLSLLERQFANWQGQVLPFTVPPPKVVTHVGNLCARCEVLGELNFIQLWPETPLDSLSAKDRSICEKIAQGLSFKEIARRLNLAPSTVSNRFYSALDKLKVENRTQLLRLLHKD